MLAPSTTEYLRRIGDVADKLMDDHEDARLYGHTIMRESLVLLSMDQAAQLSIWVMRYLGQKLSETQTKLNVAHDWTVTYDPQFRACVEFAQQVGFPESYFQAFAKMIQQKSAEEQEILVRFRSERSNRMPTIKEKLLELPVRSIQQPEELQVKSTISRLLNLTGVETTIEFRREQRGSDDVVAVYLHGDPQYLFVTMRDLVSQLGQPKEETWDAERQVFTAIWPLEQVKQAPEAPHHCTFANPN